MHEAVDVALIPLLRQYADVADAGGKSHWATAMRRAANHIEALLEYISDDCFCPCCEGVTDCNDDCTYEDDSPTDAQAMYYAREVMRDAR